MSTSKDRGGLVFPKKQQQESPTNLKVIEGGKQKTTRGISMLAEGCSFEGRMFLKGEARLGGNVQGKIFSDGYLTIEGTAKINGEINGVTVVLNGQVNGTIVAQDVLHVSASAYVTGEVYAKRLVVDDGGKIEGIVGSYKEQLREAV